MRDSDSCMREGGMLCIVLPYIAARIAYKGSVTLQRGKWEPRLPGWTTLDSTSILGTGL